MRYREDYFNFTYNIMPDTIFNYGRLFVYRLMRYEGALIENLKKTWSAIELNKPQLRSDCPAFDFDIIYPNTNHTGIIISIPEAEEEKEAAYIGITYDENNNFRYFTYEIGKGKDEQTIYFLAELTSVGEHITYSFHENRDKADFIKEISELLVFDLL